MPKSKQHKLADREDVSIAKTIVKVAMWTRIDGNAKSYTHLMHTALFLYGRTNFMFNLKPLLPKRVTMREYTSLKEKIILPLVRQGYVQKTVVAGQLTYLTLTEKGKQKADEARQWFNDKNMALHEYLEKTGQSVDE